MTKLCYIIQNASSSTVCIIEYVPVFRISPDFRQFVYCTAIRNGGIEEWEFALGLYEKDYGVWVSMEKDKLLYGMACTGQPWIQRK